MLEYASILGWKCVWILEIQTQTKRIQMSWSLAQHEAHRLAALAELRGRLEMQNTKSYFRPPGSQTAVNKMAR